MFKELIAAKRISFYEAFQTWEGAVAAACLPLIMDHTITSEYVDSIIKCVKEHGPYIIIAPDICIPHSQEGSRGVNDTAMCLMITQKSVMFNEEEGGNARLFFVLASMDNDAHLKNLQDLVEAISDEAVVEKLLNAKCITDLEGLE
ncbi:MAG: sugar transporter subunit [Clostridia bacterium]|jgi:PTS system ascorbate-specific IIA component|nr:sugar transporter subunit [Clostridia bacterium]